MFFTPIHHRYLLVVSYLLSVSTTYRTFHRSSTAYLNKSERCVHCNYSHQINSCDTFLALDVAALAKWIKEKKICFRFLDDLHRRVDCTYKKYARLKVLIDNIIHFFMDHFAFIRRQGMLYLQLWVLINTTSLKGRIFTAPLSTLPLDHTTTKINSLLHNRGFDSQSSWRLFWD